MLRIWVLTVLTETSSDRAISGRVRFVGRNRSTRSSLGLSSSGGGRRFRSMSWRRCASQEVNDIGEQGAVRRLVTWEDVEELAGVAHSKREDQPIWFSSSERGLGCGRGGVPIAQSQVREASEQMRFDECVRREAGRRHHALNVSEDSQRRGRVSLCQADRCSGEVNGVNPFVFGGELVERCARFVWHPETSEPFGDHRCENVHTGEKRLRLHGGGQRLECRLMLAATGMQHARRPCAAAPRRQGRCLPGRLPNRGAANALPPRTRPSTPLWRQPPRTRARAPGDRSSRSARPGLRPDDRVRVRFVSETSGDGNA